MPDLSQMSGVPLPSTDVPTGTVAVRVVRGDMSFNVTNHPVELHAGGQTLKGTTGDDGRAVFSGLASGTSVHAMTMVDGEQLESREFTVPQSGGVRVVLVAGATAAGAPGGGAPAGPGGATAAPSPAPDTAPPVNLPPGTVAFVGESRFIVEVVDEAVEFYALLDVRGGEQASGEAKPLVFDVPPDAVNVTLLEGSSPQAKLEGRAIKVAGPFSAVPTPVQFAYQIPYGSGRISLRQPLPAALTQTSLAVRKLPGVTFTSPQASEQREMPSDGQVYYVANGPGLAAGSTLQIDLAGLPYHSRVPRYLALALAGLVMAAGLWLLSKPAEQQKLDDLPALQRRRDRLFGDLVALEEQHLAGRGDKARYAVKRRELTIELEDLYRRIDDLTPAVPGAPRPGPLRDSATPVSAGAEAPGYEAHRA